MLGKLLKYDLKWIYKVVVVFYILAFIFSIIGRLLGNIENSIIFSILSQISLGIAAGMMVSSLINCIMRLWTRFIRNFYKDESYLTHTLPINKKTLYASKIISAVISVFTTFIVIVACLFICYYSESNIEFIKSMLEVAASVYSITVIKLLLLIACVILMQTIFVTVIGYTAIIIGHKFSQNRIVISIAIGCGLYFITQIVSLVAIFIFGVFNQDIMNLINTTDSINTDIIKYLMYGAMGLYLIYLIIYYIIGKKQFEKGVNVN